MQGVEIVNIIHSYEGLIGVEWTVNFGLIALLICFVGAITVHLDILQNICSVLICVVLFGMIICAIGYLIKTDKILDTKYEVTISDEVLMTEFYEKYEVISQNDKIFTVREKE